MKRGLITVQDAPPPQWVAEQHGSVLRQSVQPTYGYRRSIQVDPFPGYPVGVAELRRAVVVAARAFPLAHPVDVFALAHETLDHFNAQASRSFDYYGKRAPGAPAPWSGLILVNGKRIPQHPAVVRYLGAHEYGHLVAMEIADRIAGEVKDGSESQSLYPFYTALRGIPAERGRWAEDPAEVFACDFRILVAGVEPEFWPHPGIEHPSRNRAIKAWWRKVLRGEIPS